MDKELNSFLQKNKEWAASKLKVNSNYFTELSKGQSPSVLWIGCADSRVPPNTITGTEPGDLFVHRNIANVVLHDDLNLISVVEYAVLALKVEHIVVCGHYGCAGVQGAMNNVKIGKIDSWLAQIKSGLDQHESELNKFNNPDEKFNRAVELHAIKQKENLLTLDVIQNTRDAGQKLDIHAWVFDLSKGTIHEAK